MFSFNISRFVAVDPSVLYAPVDIPVAFCYQISALISCQLASSPINAQCRNNMSDKRDAASATASVTAPSAAANVKRLQKRLRKPLYELSFVMWDITDNSANMNDNNNNNNNNNNKHECPLSGFIMYTRPSSQTCSVKALMSTKNSISILCLPLTTRCFRR